MLGPEQVLGEIGGGYDLTREWFVEERLMIAARATGAAERALTPGHATGRTSACSRAA